MMTSEVTELQVPGGRLHVERAGDGPPIVLLHGGYLTAEAWDDQIDALAAAHAVIRYDARSQGRASTATTDFYPDDDLLAVLDAFAVDRAVLIGNSMGGQTAFDFAVMHPERVAALVSAAGGISPMTFDDEPFVVEQEAEQAKALEAWDGERYVEAFLRYGVDGPHRQPEQVPARIRERCQQMAMATITAHATAAGEMRWREVRPRLGEITAPALFLLGDLDLRALHRLADDAIAVMPDARKVVLPGVGHAANMEKPAEFNQAVLAFLDSLPRW